MEFEEISQAKYPETYQKRTGSMVVFSLMLWESIRFALVWTMTARALHIQADYVTAFYSLWIMAPSMAVIAGFFLLWVKQHSNSQLLIVLMIMAKGFHIVFGAAAAVILAAVFGFHPLFFRGEFLYAGLITLMDVGACILLVRVKKQQTDRSEYASVY